MIQNLPTEIQEIIYKKLHVRDRIRLLSVIPNDTRNKMKTFCKYKEKRLGVLSKAIEKKKVKKISFQIMEFIKSCEANDPTLKAISEVFPEIGTIEQTKKSIFQKIQDGTLSDEDYVDPKEYEYIIYKCPPSIWTILWNKENVKEWMTRYNGRSFLFNLFNYGNKALIEFLKNDDNYPWPWTETRDYILKNPNIMLRKNVREILLEYFTFSKAELTSIWEYAISEMDIDSSLDIDNEIMKINNEIK